MGWVGSYYGIMMIMPDKYSATWTSHSSISDYLACPRSYYLKNVYKDPVTRNKIQLVSPAVSLGVAVHEVLEGLAVLPSKERFKESLLVNYERFWQEVTGERGGFLSKALEHEVYERGKQMLLQVQENPGPLKNLAVRIKQDLPNFYLSEEDNIILCGKVDWLEYNPANESVHIIDFKTSRSMENEKSLQLAIYQLLAQRCQKYTVSGASYWYLALDNGLVAKELPSVDESESELLEIGRKIALARKLKSFKCPRGGCPACAPFEKILRGEAKQVGVNEAMRRDLYLLSLDGKGEETEEIL